MNLKDEVAILIEQGKDILKQGEQIKKRIESLQQRPNFDYMSDSEYQDCAEEINRAWWINLGEKSKADYVNDLNPFSFRNYVLQVLSEDNGLDDLIEHINDSRCDEVFNRIRGEVKERSDYLIALFDGVINNTQYELPDQGLKHGI